MKRCAGFNTLELLDPPLAGSPKFQEIELTVAPLVNENDIAFCRQVSIVLIKPLQHNPIEILLQIVVTGKPGS